MHPPTPTPSGRAAGMALAFLAFGRTFRSGLSCRRALEPSVFKEEAAETGEGAWCRWRPCRWGDVLQESPCLRPLGGLGVLICVPVFHYEHLRPRLLRKRSPWGPQLQGCSRPSANSGNPVCREDSRSETLTPDMCGDPAHTAGPRACPDKASEGQEGRCFPP